MKGKSKTTNDKTKVLFLDVHNSFGEFPDMIMKSILNGFYKIIIFK